MSTLSTHAELYQLISILEKTEQEVLRLRAVNQWLGSLLSFPEIPNHQEVMFMLKNKFGFTKEQAKKLYSSYRNKDSDQGKNEGGQKPEEPQSIDDKISMIMDYMQETSSKLDRIEDDISYLKQQVENILKRI